MGGRQTEANGPRPGLTALKAGAGFGVWDNSALGLERVKWNIGEFIWKFLLTGGERRRSINREVSPGLVLLKL